MSVEAELPDGTVLEFPDGTAPEIVQQTVKQHLGQAPRAADVVRSEYAALPWYKKPLVAADDTIRMVADPLTFGMADRVAGALNGTGTEHERALTEEARTRAGDIPTAIADIGGSLATVGGLAKNGLSLAGKFGTNAMKGVNGLLARSGLMGAEGAGYGAANAAGHDQDVEHGALMGAIFGTGSNAAGEGIANTGAKIAGLFNKAPVIPTRAAVQSAADSAYAAADNSGVVFTPQAVDDLYNGVVSKLADFGYDPALQPGAATALNRLRGIVSDNAAQRAEEAASEAFFKDKNAFKLSGIVPYGSSDPYARLSEFLANFNRAAEPSAPAVRQPLNVTLKGLDTIRKVANNGLLPNSHPAAKYNNGVIGMIVNGIDDIIANPDAAHVLSGDAGAAAQALADARGYWGRLAKSDRVEKAIEDAQFATGRTANTVGGLNDVSDISLRQRMDALRKSKNGTRGFTDDENDALAKAIMGSPGQNFAANLGRFSPNRPVNATMGSAAGAGIGAMLGGPTGATIGSFALPAAGYVARKTADAMSRRNVEDLIDIIMAGGSKAATLPPVNAVQRGLQTNKTAIGRALMANNLGSMYTGEQ